VRRAFAVRPIRGLAVAVTVDGAFAEAPNRFPPSKSPLASPNAIPFHLRRRSPYRQLTGDRRNADANKQRSVPSKDWKPKEIREKAVGGAGEYLATLDEAAFGAASPVIAKFISRSGPAALRTGAH